MNYLAHGYRFLHTPAFVAGTAVPDWLCVVDRRVRVRSRRLLVELSVAAPDADQQLVAGMLQHLQDDDTFHRNPVFLMLESEVGLRFRRQMPDPFDHRPGFLGHIVTELLLDAFLAEGQPELLADYYSVLTDMDAQHIQSVVNRVATRPTELLAVFVNRFREARFLYDYLNNNTLLARLNQVLSRVKLPQIDEQCLSVLRDARVLLRDHGGQLLQDMETTGTTAELHAGREAAILVGRPKGT